MSNEDIHNELKKITTLLTFAHSDKIETELEKIASTDERKMIWALLTGENDNKMIADRISVQRSLRMFKETGFAHNPWGKPASRIINYVPPSWIDLLPPETDQKEKVANE